jgi:hypothetical protein
VAAGTVDIQAMFKERLDQIDADGGESAAPAEEEASAQETAPRVVEDEQPADDESAVSEEDEQSEVAAADSEDEAAEEDAPIETLAELAESLQIDGVDEDALLDQLSLEDEDGNRFTLRQAVERYRTAEADSEAFSAAVDERVSEYRTGVDDHVQQLTAVTSAMIQRYEGQVSSVDMERLKQEDPGRYIAVQDQLTADRREIEAAIEALKVNEQRVHDEAQAQHDEWVKTQARLVIRRMPSWREPETLQAAQEDINWYMDKAGASDEQKQGLEDALAIETVWKAAQYDKAQAKKPGALKKLRGLPSRKALEQTARREVASVSAQDKKRASALARFRETGRVEDAVDLFGEHLD